MRRIEWGRYGGDDVEAVVAMMVNREHPNSVRVTPSRGDGGVDILDADAGPNGGDVVYQVKRYARPLSKKQQGEIEASLARLLGTEKDERWTALNVTEWRLVTPWDPTPEAWTWLQGLGVKHQVPVIWDGLTVIDRWCAAYPEVVDYYIHGGRERIEGAYRQMLALTSLSPREMEGVDVRALAERVNESLKGPLTEDPHYRYEFRFGTGPLPPPAPVPWLVMSAIEGNEHGWFAVDVFARCAASAEARPITSTGTLSAPRGTPAEDALRRFVEYGDPPDVPFSFTGDLDAPGGLATTLTDATVEVFPLASADLGENVELRLEVLDPEGGVVATVDADRVDRGSGTKGLSSTLREVNNVFTLNMTATLSAGPATADPETPTPTAHMTMRLKMNPLTGAAVAAVAAATRFLAEVHEPNQLRLSLRHVPAVRGGVQPLTGATPHSNFVRIAKAVEALNTIQQHTLQVIRVPDLTTYRNQFHSWERAAQLLTGEPLTTRYPEDQCLIVELAQAGEAAPDGLTGGSIRFVTPLNVVVGPDTLRLGEVRIELDDPTVHSRRLLPDGTLQMKVTTPDRAMRSVHHLPEPSGD
ncbi:restriction endonuclease [Cellulomonas sp. S1-8]|uniref:restriction endonuclease n=1 Tax=Cellulomonas sp. S1-8 TaxID=2904790 RepID=UPI002243EF96|nr:restriction endonuclease [Cellulomonas sp. S1-8]UZN04805.1 restriction endonuclease [Cellulomonas sp. S1-8]